MNTNFFRRWIESWQTRRVWLQTPNFGAASSVRLLLEGAKLISTASRRAGLLDMATNDLRAEHEEVEEEGSDRSIFIEIFLIMFL